MAVLVKYSHAENESSRAENESSRAENESSRADDDDMTVGDESRGVSCKYSSNENENSPLPDGN